MKKGIVYSLLFLAIFTSAKAQQRLAITSVAPEENTGQVYTPWLNDNLDDLVKNVWSSNNFRYVDVKLALTEPGNVGSISLYDFEGIFTDNPASIYAVKGNEKTFLGNFTGESYMKWIDIKLETPVAADAIIIHKYGNNIPQKIKLFASSAASKVQSVIDFAELTTKTAGDAPFTLLATSNNNSTPITFSSSDDNVVSVTFTNNVWKATIVAPGEAQITASQDGKGVFLTATDVTRTQVVNAGLIQSVINFPNLAAKTVGDAPFALTATSNNTGAPITYTSSNPSVVKVSNIDGVWTATVLTAGSAIITASQKADDNFLTAANVAKTQVVAAAPSTVESNRIKVISATPGVDVKQDFSAWLNDDLNSLVSSSWNWANFQYVDVVLSLEFKSKISKISLYDVEGVFNDKPALLYAVSGNKETLVGTFTGEKYKQWVDFDIDNPIIAETIIIRKYGNNIPQKIKVFGQRHTTTETTQSVISFDELDEKIGQRCSFQPYGYQ